MKITPAMRRQLAAEMGKKGGEARSLKLSPERRSQIARNAVNERWKNREKKA